MADNAQVTPIGRSLNKIARGKALDQIQQTGRSLPCVVVGITGAIVTVSFQVTAQPGQTAITIPNATIPIMESEYVRLPIQVGCKGFAIAADAYLGGMSGLGGGTATTVQNANLSALAFAPIGNSTWTTVDGSVLTMYGPNGVKLSDQGGASIVSITPTEISLTSGGHSIVISSAGVVIDGKVFLTHEHSGGTIGAGNTGGVV